MKQITKISPDPGAQYWDAVNMAGSDIHIYIRRYQ